MIKRYFLFLLVITTTFVNAKEVVEVRYNNKNVMYEGRIGESVNKEATEIYWSGSSIKINFEGTEVSAIIKDENGLNYFNIIIDGIPVEILKLEKGKKTYVLAENLIKGKHSVELTKRNEWTYGKSLFYAFQLKGKILKRDKKKDIFIEFYGDSITAGHGNEDYTGEDKPDGNVTNNYTTYAAETARAFNAEYSCIARGGIGIMVSWFNMIMPEMYDRLNPSDETSKWNFNLKQPDIVVVNLFQNDSWIVKLPEHEEFKRRFNTAKPSEEEIIKAYTNFIKTVRNKYNNAAIVCLLGNMDITKEGSLWPGYVSKAVELLNDNNVFTCFAPYKDSPGHPKVEEHTKIATELIKTIKNEILK